MDGNDGAKILEALYKKAVQGIPKVSVPIEKFANDYLKKNPNPEKAVKAMLKNQVKKCTTSGVITGFGGVVTLPASIPANMGSVWYMQMRMVACTAYMAGYDIHDDQVQTFVYAALVGVGINQLAKNAGVKAGMKFAEKGIQKIPGKVLVKVNQKIGFRFVTKFGEKGIVNLGKMIPGVGAAINGGFDYFETKAIAHRAYKMFFEGDFSGENQQDEIVVDIED